MATRKRIPTKGRVQDRPKLRIGVLSPTTIQFVEKMASLFPGDRVVVVGPPNADGWGWNDYRRRQPEWEAAGLSVSIDDRPYDQIPFGNFDVLIETFETLAMERSWVEQCTRFECPVVVKACWTRSPAELCSPEYFNKIKDIPILLEMPAHVPIWDMAGMNDVSLLFNPVGEWWFETPWTGKDKRAVMVLSGKDQWRRQQHHGLDLLDRLQDDFPGQIHLHDGLKDYKTSQEMAEMLGGARCFLALDEPYGQGERPLSLVFTEALSVGCPVAARDLPGLSYRSLIDGNGVASNSYEEIRDFVGRCLSDLEFAKACSANSRRIAKQNFALDVLQPRYLDVFARAKDAFHEHQTARRKPTTLSALSRLEIE